MEVRRWRLSEVRLDLFFSEPKTYFSSSIEIVAGSLSLVRSQIETYLYRLHIF